MDIGIDLGTTFSVIGVNGKVDLAPDYPPGIYLAECDVTVIPSPHGEQTFPSVVLDDPDAPARQLFGVEALEKSSEGYAPVMFSKRRMGTREAIPMLERTVLAREVARDFLRHLKSCAERALGRPVRRAVVTHPAYFDRGAVEETREAAIAAGFDMSLPEQMLMEPVAAALTYTRTDKRDPLRLLTYDLGGGTFDVTYMERAGGVIDVRAFDGDSLLGGYNFDRELVHWLRTRLEARGRAVSFDETRPEDRARLARLLRLAEGVKIALAKAPSSDAPVEFRVRGVLVDASGREVQANERLSRAELVRMIQPYIDRTLECSRRALEKAKVGPSDVDEVLLVGGSTYGPWISESVAAAFPGSRPKLFFPDLCVGAGAAIHAKMVLPPVVEAPGCKVLLEVPETSVLEMINVAGTVMGAGDGRAAAPLAVTLRLPDGSDLGPRDLTAEGRFYFPGVALQEGAANAFVLRVARRDGGLVLEHAFQVLHAPESADASSVTTVLPRPLFILTQEGLVPLAEEGVALPARCCQTFQRQNDNPNLSILLYQEADPIGEIRIEDIPAEGGRGSLVDLEVEVTEKNQVRGAARVRTKEGRIVAKANVGVHFDVPEVPSAEELIRRYGELAERWRGLRDQGQALGAEARSRAEGLLAEVARMLEQQPLERQEVHEALRRLARVLEPPKDDMDPTREVFCQAAARCLESLGEMRAKASAVLGSAREGGKASQTDAAEAQQARKALEKVDRYGKLVETIVQEGLQAHARRDREHWARLYDALTDVEAQVRERRKVEAPPTVIVKLFTQMKIMSSMSRLEEAAGKIEEAGRWDDWRGEVQRIQRGLEEALRELHGVDDGLPADQGRAQVHRIFARKLQPLEEAIEKIGIDIAKVKKA
ncbi:MAG: Hsp70 family protein [Planctomycetes bacterium]|nr:Hsp70 family protein [Planctomycetota bacterium]